MALNGSEFQSGDDANALPRPDSERRIEVAPGRSMTVREWRRDGRAVARLAGASR